MKKLLFLGLLSSLLIAESQIDERFEEKYLKDIPKIRSEISVEELHESSKDINLSKVGVEVKNIKKDVNSTFYRPPENFMNDKAANDIDKFVRSKDFQKEVKAAEDYILNDKDFDFGKYAYSEQTQAMLKDMESKSHIRKNEYLDGDEKLFIIISSSLKDQTLKNYFSDLQNVTSDVTYVMRGIVGNDIRYFKPTQEFMIKAMSKKSITLEQLKDMTDEDFGEDDVYDVSIEINPKITRRFAIERVPAVLFIKNYNPAVQDHQNFIGTPDENEKHYIAYGETSIAYALQEINKRAKSKGLERLIKSMNKSFYNTEAKNEK